MELSIHYLKHYKNKTEFEMDTKNPNGTVPCKLNLAKLVEEN